MTDGHHQDEPPRDELSRRLKVLFEAAGMSTVRAAQLLNERGVKASQARVSRALTGRTPAQPAFAASLAELVKATPEERDRLETLAGLVQAGNRRLVLGRDWAAFQERMGRYTRNAKLIRAFGLAGVHHLAQLEPYVRQVMGDTRGAEARLRNQAILDEPGREFVWILPEGALGFPALLPPDGMAQQLEHWIALSRRPNMRLGIIPWGSRCPALPVHSYDLFDAQVVVTGGETYGLDLDHADDVAAYVELTDELERVAVWGANARQLVGLAARRYRDHAAEIP